jgi:enoyl-CoA hydratase
MMAKFETISLEKRDDGIAVLMLNRPERLNPINDRMIDEINAALDAVEADDDIRVLVLHGKGRAFCAGFDLKEEAKATGSGLAYWRPTLQRQFNFVMRFWHLSKPTIAAVHTYCLAFGCELALACDLTVAAEGTRFGEPELKFGSGILVLLMPWMMNPKRAKEMLLTGHDKIDALEALELGMINRVVPQGQHLHAALELAQTIATMDSDAVRLTKHAINRAYEIMGMLDALAMGLDVEIQLESLETPDRQKFKEISQKEGLQAALAWRNARFKK